MYFSSLWHGFYHVFRMAHVVFSVLSTGEKSNRHICFFLCNADLEKKKFRFHFYSNSLLCTFGSIESHLFHFSFFFVYILDHIYCWWSIPHHPHLVLRIWISIQLGISTTSDFYLLLVTCHIYLFIIIFLLSSFALDKNHSAFNAGSLSPVRWYIYPWHFCFLPPCISGGRGYPWHKFIVTHSSLYLYESSTIGASHGAQPTQAAASAFTIRTDVNHNLSCLFHSLILIFSQHANMHYYLVGSTYFP